MDAGKMPNTRRLIENGAMAQLATLHPPLSPMLWTSIATGKRPFKHGIHGFSEPLPNGMGVRPITNLSRKCKAVWNILNQNGKRSVVIGWWPSHPAEPLRGVTVSDHYHRASGPIRDKTGPLHEIWPLLPGTVHPPELAQTLAELRFHPDELTPAMVEPFIPKGAEIDQNKDKRLASLMKILCECVSVHSAAATWLIENQPWDFFAVYFDAIDHFCHGFMKYHPPRQQWIGERDFELYGNVVNQAYQLHDQMLGTLLEKAGPESTVILMSDHGFHPDHLRPWAIPEIPAGPAIEHSDFGILVVSGPGIKKDELLYGANVLDIAPTLLALYGLPVGADMDGKVLRGAFEEGCDPAFIPSWEEVPGDDGRHPPHLQLDPIAAKEAMEQMIALGYIERPGEDIGQAVADTIDELRYNLGEAYQDDDRHYEAAGIFRELYGKDPDEQRYAVHYFISCQALGHTDELRRIVDDLDGRRRAVFHEAAEKLKEFREIMKTRLADKAEESPEGDARLKLLTPEERKEFARWRRLANYQPAVVDYLKGQVLTAERRYAEALECLGKVTQAHLARPGLLLQTGDLYRKLGRFREARLTYERALEIDPDNPHAHLGLARVALRRQQWERAAEHALNCVQRLYQYPMAHFLLGVALTGMRDYPAAADALRAAISLNPNFPEAHRRLAVLLGDELGDPEAAEAHRALWQRMRRKNPRKSRLAPDTGVLQVRTGAGSDVLRRVKPENAAPVEESLVIVSGLPRSGTSVLMQMLAAGGMPVLTDGLREADEDNPRGYFEFEPVKKLLQGSEWLREVKGKAVKIVAPLLPGLPRGIPCRIIFIERDLDEILDSQSKMIARGGEAAAPDLERRELLKAEYARTVARVKAWLSRRPETAYLILEFAAVLADPAAAAASLGEFLDGRVDAKKVASLVDRSLHRNRQPVTRLPYK